MWPFLRLLIATNLKASVSLRGAFLLQVLLMAANNLIFSIVWWVFFDNYREVRGWRRDELLLLYGVTASAYGLSVIFGGGVRNLARVICDGDLDAYMVQPKDLLLHTVGSHSRASGWGDLLSAVILFALSGYLTWDRLPWIVLMVLTSAVLFLSTAVVIHSLAFWARSMEGFAAQLTEFIIIFSVYPQNVYSGALKLFLFTVIPAGFIGHLPVELIREFRWSYLAAVLGAAAGYALLARAVFHRGLRLYESGNRFGVRA
jgi:ABC-2 type transport system permease protein